MATINLALNRPATASNSVMPYTASKAVNGSTAPFSRWLCNTLPGWLCVDFGAPYWINRWVVRNMPVAGWRAPDFNMSDFKLQGSNDNTRWTDIDGVVGNTASICDRTFTPACFRYARLYVTKGLRTNTQLASVMELEVYQAPSAYLTGLTISSGVISPAFAKTTFQYTTANVAYSTSSVTVTPTAEDPQAVIKVNGVAVASGQAATVALNVGSNAISVAVTGAGGAPVNTYTITVVRLGSPYLTNLTLGGIPLSFAKNTYTYTANVANSVASTVVTPTLEDSTAATAITVNGTAVTAGQTANLNVGTNTIAVTVTAYGGAQQTYTVTVVREQGAVLSNLTISSGTLSPTFNSSTLAYTTQDVGYDTTSVTVTPTTSAAGATIAVNGTATASGQAATVNLAVGSNTINVVVTNGAASQTYTITLTRASSPYLKTLTFSTGRMPFTKNVYTVNVNVGNATASTVITATAEDSTATIVISLNGMTYTSGVSSIPLAVGINPINIKVTSAIGVDNRTYVYNINRSAT